MFDEDEEVDGVEVGHYSDFAALRDYVTRELEGGRAGTRFPTLVIHSDCDGEWSPTDCGKLIGELAELAVEMRQKAPPPFGVGVAEIRCEIDRSDAKERV